MNKTKASIELGDVVRRFGPAYIKNQGERLLSSHPRCLIYKCYHSHDPSVGQHLSV